MNSTREIINAIDHRPWELPSTQWTYYQEWNRSLFLHWIVPGDILRQLVPTHLELDVYEGNMWVSLVAFTMEQIRPKYLPSVSYLSNFHEINLRTYVKSGNKSGVYFLTIEAGKYLSAYTARILSGLPYERASMLRISENPQRYVSTNKRRSFHLDASFIIGKKEAEKSGLDLFLTEKYCLYMEKSGRLFRYDIHHRPWDLYKVEHLDIKVDYNIGGLALSMKPDLVHYSDGVKVIAWNKTPVVL